MTTNLAERLALRARIAANPLVSDTREDSVCNCGQRRSECRCEADDAERYGAEEDGDD